MDIDLSFERISQLAHAIAGEDPDRVYEAPMHHDDGDPICVYVWDDAPSCIVGHILNRAGVPVAELAKHDTEGGESARQVSSYFGASKRVQDYLGVMQGQQDTGTSWGASVARADNVMGVS